MKGIVFLILVILFVLLILVLTDNIASSRQVPTVVPLAICGANVVWVRRAETPHLADAYYVNEDYSVVLVASGFDVVKAIEQCGLQH